MKILCDSKQQEGLCGRRKIVEVRMQNGTSKKIRFQIADVSKILVSVSKVTAARNKVTMRDDGGEITDKEGNTFNMVKRNGVYVMNIWTKRDPKEGNVEKPFSRQAR